MTDTNLEPLIDIVGEGDVVRPDEDLAPYTTEWRGIARGMTPLVLKPRDTAQVSQILRYCHQAGIPVVPQGGNTGLCGGAVPDETGEQVVLNLSRLNDIREVNPLNFSMTVGAGCILENLQKLAEDNDRLFPLSLAAEGSCQIGGNLSTDAGGINVVRYGTAREQVLGLEVVLANGDVMDGLRGLRKDTAGYDLKQLFLGSEGTLGIITAACLKLYPRPEQRVTALVGLSQAAGAINLLSRLRAACGDAIDAFELMSPVALSFLQRHKPEVPLPIDGQWCVLLEVSGRRVEDDLQQALMQCLDEGLLVDAVVAKNAGEAGDLWRLRHSISEVQKQEGVSLKHDVAVPIDRIPELLERGDTMLSERAPGARLCAFGHVGDGNLHYNVSQPVDVDPDAFRALGPGITEALYEIVRDLGGTFSAEHGVGSFKREWLMTFRSPEEMALMRSLKAALDPKGILNPGKVI